MEMRKKDTAGGLILVGIGLWALLNQFVTINLPGNLGLLFLPGLGAMFLAWGILTRNGGLMIPGGILSGIGWGAYAISGPFSVWQGDSEGGVFLMSLGLGFGLITLVTAVFTNKTHMWALIPGSIIFLVGTSILFGGAMLTAVSLLGKLWPVGLILLGATVLYKGIKENGLAEKSLKETF
ncbi:hypothetical protein MNBD_CHLOROFLEXI01-4620 [hydrothermal vent metagenome]|uniref:Uncharacterized protein n=1 Tax=hydrothermal vent metagenome TaxID=652676 RepID=A0A3B0V7F5_9ZZZZ